MNFRKSIARLGAALLAGAFAMYSQIPQEPEAITRGQQNQATLLEIQNNKTEFAAKLAAKWEVDARASGKWDERFSYDLLAALMKVSAAKLLLAQDAPSYEAFLSVLATGHLPRSKPPRDDAGPIPGMFGDAADDLVFTPVKPCRVVDTRSRGSALTANNEREFDLDGSNLSAQGGSTSGCGLPYAVVTAAALTLTVTQPSQAGYLTAFAVGGTLPNASVLNFAAGQTVANTTIVPINPGPGFDFIVSSSANTQLIVDVVGYFAAPVATAITETDVSAKTVVGANTFSGTKASCPAGTTITGGSAYADVAGIIVAQFANQNAWTASAINTSNTDTTLYVFAVCASTPGR